MVDTETTLGPDGRSHVIELAVVRIDQDGRVVDEFESLVRADVPLGGVASRVHGIRTGDLAGAPPFAGAFLAAAKLLRSAIPMAHQADFDERAINGHLHCLGLEPVQLGCTIRLGKALGLIHGRRSSLAHCCEHFGIDLDGAHTALGDARATASLLGIYLQHFPASEATERRGLGLPLPTKATAWQATGFQPARAFTRADAAARLQHSLRERARRGHRPRIELPEVEIHQRLADVEHQLTHAAGADRVHLLRERIRLRSATTEVHE